MLGLKEDLQKELIYLLLFFIIVDWGRHKLLQQSINFARREGSQAWKGLSGLNHSHRWVSLND